MSILENITEEQYQQEIEIILSVGDFRHMSLEKLKIVEKEINNFREANKDNLFAITSHQVKTLNKLQHTIDAKSGKHEAELVKVGYLFYTSWGYDQTQVEYWKVTKISKTGKTCKVVQVKAMTVPGSEGRDCDSVTPNPEDEYDRPECTVRIQRSTVFSPYTNTHEPLGDYHLRGSVWYSEGHKHLQTLYRVDPTRSEYRSWYR